MDRQTETLKTAKHIFKLFCAPIPLVLMRLNADSVNGNSCFKTFLNYMSICLGGVKIVYKKLTAWGSAAFAAANTDLIRGILP